MNRSPVWLAALLLLASCSIVYAGYDEGSAALNSGDFIRAYNEFKYAADQGDARAQNRVGVMNDIGQGIPQNYTEALKWYRKAAEQGVADAQYNLGMMYIIGKGVPQDAAEAIKWLRYAADQGQVRAQNTLGYLNATGQGVAQNYARGGKMVPLCRGAGICPCAEQSGGDVLQGRGSAAGLRAGAHVVQPGGDERLYGCAKVERRRYRKDDPGPACRGAAPGNGVVSEKEVRLYPAIHAT